MKATIYISLKDGVLDPQGKAIENALGQLGFNEIDNVRQGKMIELDLADTDASEARDRLQEMCEKLLANTVIENFDIRLNDAE